MSRHLPSVTVIIAARPEQTDIQAVAAARRLDYPPDRLDIVVARGKQPSIQRNAAMKSARGDWIYFLDDDAVALPQNLQRALIHVDDPAVKMVGGPNLCPPDAPGIEQVFAVVLASWVAFGPSRARYWPVGEPRQSSEKELILCNLMARKEALLEFEGFNEALYPNEENALMDELMKRGGKLIYDPRFVVHRRPRRSLRSFFKMLFTYGRGRAEQFRLHPTFGSAPNFAPPLFCLYLALLFGVVVSGAGGAATWWLAAPLAPYGAALAAQTLVSMRAGVARGLAALPLLVASHVFYGLGFWRGLFTTLHRDKDRPHREVILEQVGL